MSHCIWGSSLGSYTPACTHNGACSSGGSSSSGGRQSTAVRACDDQVWLEGRNLLARLLDPLLLHLQQRGPGAPQQKGAHKAA